MKRVDSNTSGSERLAMKALFLPASDELLNDGSVHAVKLVPFKPEFLAVKQDRKPRNWITPSSYQDALNRLHGLSSS